MKKFEYPIEILREKLDYLADDRLPRLEREMKAQDEPAVYSEFRQAADIAEKQAAQLDTAIACLQNKQEDKI